MTEVAAKIMFLRDCHEADSREAAITDVFGDRLTHRHFLTGRDVLLDQICERLAIDPIWAEEAQKTVSIYRRERTLFYAAFLFTAPANPARGRDKPLCAPLILVPAAIEQEDVARETFWYIRPKLDELRLNYPVIEALATAGVAAPTDPVELFEGAPRLPFDVGALADLLTRLERLCSSLDVGKLGRFPELMDAASVELFRIGKASPADGKEVACLPAALLAVVENSPQSRGVLSELKALSNRPSTPVLNVLLGTPAAQRVRHRKQRDRAPAVLNDAQGRALESCRSQLLTGITGPPGTGKTFTVAAIALDHLFRGESVLVATRTPEALDVVADKIEALTGHRHLVTRGGRADTLRRLKDHLEDLLQGNVSLPKTTAADLDRSEKRLRHVERQIDRLEGQLTQRVARELLLGQLTTPPHVATFLERRRAGFLMWRLQRAAPMTVSVAEYVRLFDERASLMVDVASQRLRRRIDRVLENKRDALKRFVAGIRANTSARQAQRFEATDFSAVLAACPIWLVCVADVHRVLPLAENLFDLALIDEATQMDMASGLPVLARAKRAAVTGDLRQLRHLSFLSRARLNAIATNHGVDSEAAADLDYREHSLLDLVTARLDDHRAAIFLDEHYRSRPPIIEFANRVFYRDALKIMTATPSRDDSDCLELRPVTGARLASGVNPAEADAVVAALMELLDAERGSADDTASSLGVLSPFRDQVDALAELVRKRLSVADLARHNIKIGTPYSFQGDERDIMLISWAIDNSAHGMTRRYLERADVFNVSITRARRRQLVFSSITPEQAGGHTLLGQYLAHIQSGRAAQRPRVLVDPLAREVAEAAERLGCTVWPDYPLAGTTMDLVVTRNNAAMALDLIGPPGPPGHALPRERYRSLYRAGMPVVPIAWSEWRHDARPLLELIDGMLS
ncbi:MAG: hypothetical protein A2289_02035 [Deltaproteobacteria bacterium RIFOXYA12_FULL_58_15]|nr:MAG: hypothetical protein A2289_02035 [Deltaproteobacteria bacterium RIFOXYA12_FULL_58_15]OGR10079.1 MAG: hypothetical protein A2341_21295 [Deltaproteobacteria bacterium RIFOXYB12_FULL_58_9]